MEQRRYTNSWREKNRGQITVFLCLLLTFLLLLGLTMLEAVRLNTGEAKLAQAASGAEADVKANYNRELFDRYHLYGLDSSFQGQGEGRLEENINDYLTYTLTKGTEDSLLVDEVTLISKGYLLDEDALAMRQQIKEYMKLYSKKAVSKKLITMVTENSDCVNTVNTSIDNGRDEETDKESTWKGRSPIKNMKKNTKAGLLYLVLPEDAAPSRVSVPLTEVPSKNKKTINKNYRDKELNMDDLDVMKKQIAIDEKKLINILKTDSAGIAYALDHFDSYLGQGVNSKELSGKPFSYELEYIICGKDSDYKNLSGVVNRIIMHRMAVNYSYVLMDASKMAEIESIAVSLNLTTGVPYGVTKYLLVGCLAYGESIVEVKSLLMGNGISFLKHKGSWLTDINHLDKLVNLSAADYTGPDRIDYKGFLTLLLAESRGAMYFRMADLMQLNIKLQDDSFYFKNMLYCFSAEAVVSKNTRFMTFINSGSGVRNTGYDKYVYTMNICGSY